MISGKDISLWEEAPLFELLSVLETGARPKGGVDRYKTGIPSLGGEHLTASGKFFLRNLKFIPEDFAEKLTRGKIARGDVLIVKDGATTGKCVLVPDSFPLPEAYINEHVFLCRFWPVLESRFFAYFLRSELGQKRILDNFRGAAQGGIPQSFAENTLVPVAPADEQKRIADKLDVLLSQVDTCREHLDRVPGILKRFRQAVLVAATSGRLTEGWREQNNNIKGSKQVTLNETGSDTSYGSSAKSQISGIIPVLRMGNIQNGKLDWADLVYTSDKKEIEKYKLHPGDVLFNRTNSPELVGKTAVYKGEKPSIYAGYLIRVKCSPTLLPDYLNYCLNSPDGRDWCWRVKSDGVSQSNINAQKLGEFQFLLPSLKEQEEIVRRVEDLFTYADRLESRYQIAHSLVDNLTPALLAKAFRGELMPQETNDEPASVLLERIRAEREARAKENGLHHQPTRKKTGSKVEGVMRKLTEIKPTHLSDILKENGSMLAEKLWAASELEIEDFYDQLKDEELKGLLQEIRTPLNDLVSMLEAL